MICHVMRQDRTRDVARRVRIQRSLGRPPGPGRAMEAPGARRPLPDRPVGAPTVEVRHVLDQHATQMPLVQDQ